MQSLFKFILFGFIFCLLGCDQGGSVTEKINEARARNDGPPLWVIKDVDSTLYLYGTVHLLPSQTIWEKDDMRAVFDASGTIFFEVDTTDKSLLEANILTSSLGLYRDGQRLSDKLDSYQLKLLDAAVNNANLNLAVIDSMRPWLASEFLTFAAAKEAGLSAELSADSALKSRAKRLQKNVLYLDTIESQIRMSANQDAFVQMAMLSDALSGFNALGSDLTRVAEAWAVGHIDFLTTEIVQAAKVTSPEMYTALFSDRNTKWAQELTKFMEGSGTGFVAVGIGHLLGEDCLQSRMQDKGYTVSRYYSFQGEAVIKPAFTPTH